MPVPGKPLANSRFALNALEFIGLIGGTEVISVMAMIPLYGGRRWLGWYNTPGSLGIARHLGNFASSFQTRLYGNQSPATLPAFDKAGPKFIAAFSGKETQSGHLGYLTVKRSEEMAQEIVGEIVGESSATPLSVTLLDLQGIDMDRPFPLLHITHTLPALIPMATSIATCTMCAFVSDWCMFFVILVGVFTSGFASTVIGSGRLILESPRWSPPGTAPGRGILVSRDTVVVLRGDDLSINAIKRGKFNLEGGKHWQDAIRVCSLLYLAEFLVQLILTPQGTTFGHIMFIISLGVSWTCSHRFFLFQEKLQAELLFTKLGEPKIRKFRVGTRTMMTVFICLLLFQDVHHLASSNEYNRILTALLPNTTPVWRGWKDRVIKQLHNANDTSLSHLKVNGEDQSLLSEPDKKFLQAILGDAAAAFQGYFYLCTSHTSFKEY